MTTENVLTLKTKDYLQQLVELLNNITTKPVCGPQNEYKNGQVLTQRSFDQKMFTTPLKNISTT